MLLGPGVAWSAQPTPRPDDRLLGNPSAATVIVEYASLTCPHCAAFHREVLPLLVRDWIAPGKARLAFRDFPLDRIALQAAMLARCQPPPRYFDFIGVLFARQGEWAFTAQPLEALRALAAQQGLAAQRIDSCLADEKLSDSVVGSRLEAEREFGVGSTPTFFINGVKLEGDWEYPAFDAALRRAAPR